MPCIIHPSPSFAACAPRAGDFRMMSGQISTAHISTAQWKSATFSGYFTTRPSLHVNRTCRSDLPTPTFVLSHFTIYFRTSMCM